MAREFTFRGGGDDGGGNHSSRSSLSLSVHLWRIDAQSRIQMIAGCAKRSACWPRPMVMWSSSTILMDGIEQELCWWLLLNYFPVSLRFQGLIKIRSCTHIEEIRDGGEEEDHPWPSEAAAAILQIKRYHFVTCNFPMICCCRKRIPTTTDHHHQHDRNNRLVHVLIICRSQFVCRQSLYSVARRNKERNQRWIRK